MMLTIVNGPTTLDDDRRVQGLNDLDAGRIVLTPPPAPVRAPHLYWQILERCGRTLGPDLMPGEFTDRVWPVAALGGHDVRHVFVVHADTMPDDAVRAIAAVIHDAAASAWLLADDPPRLPFGPFEARRLSWATFEADWLGRAGDATASNRLPADLSSDAPGAGSWGAITASALAGFASVAGWSPTGDDREAIASALCALLSDRSDAVCRSQMLDGAEGPLYYLGWKVRPGATALLASPAAPSRLLALDRYADPLGAAAGYLLGRFLIRPDDALDLRLRDVAGDAAAVCIDGDWHPLDRIERTSLRGLLRTRERAADGPHDYFLDAPDFSRSAHSLVSRVGMTYHAVGLDDLELTMCDRPGPHERRLARLDLTLHFIPRGDRVRRGPTGFNAVAIEDEMRAAARHLDGADCRCWCAVAHRAPIVGEIPPWPPRPKRAALDANHPFRRNAWRHRLPNEFDPQERDSSSS